MSAEKKLPKGVSQRKDGSFMWRFQYHGESYCGYEKTAKAAEKEMNRTRTRVEDGEYTKERKITMDAWFSEWIETFKAPKCKDSTIYVYCNDYNIYIKPTFGKKQLRNITNVDIQRYLNDFQKSNLSKSSVVRIEALLHRLFRKALEVGLIAKDPLSGTEIPSMPESEKKEALSRSEEQQFFDFARSNSSYYPIYRLSALTGMRIGEILGLSWHDIDFGKGEIHINHTLTRIPGKGIFLSTPKSKSGCRVIHMEQGNELYTLLKKQRIKQAQVKFESGQPWEPWEGMENLVFTSRKGHPLYDNAVRHDLMHLRKRMREQGIEIRDFSFHVLRHTFATRAVEGGMSPKTLQAILGHADFQTTMNRYVSATEDTKRKEMEMISKAL